MSHSQDVSEGAASEIATDAYEKFNAINICLAASIFWIMHLYLSWVRGTAPEMGIVLMIAVVITALFPYSLKALVGIVMVSAIAIALLCLAHAYVFANWETMPSWMFQKQLGLNTIRSFDKNMVCLTGCKTEYGEISNDEYERLRDFCKPLGVMQSRYSADEKFVYVRCGRGFTALTVFAERGAFERTELEFKALSGNAAKESTP